MIPVVLPTAAVKADTCCGPGDGRGHGRPRGGAAAAGGARGSARHGHLRLDGAWFRRDCAVKETTRKWIRQGWTISSVPQWRAFAATPTAMLARVAGSRCIIVCPDDRRHALLAPSREWSIAEPVVAARRCNAPAPPWRTQRDDDVGGLDRVDHLFEPGFPSPGVPMRLRHQPAQGAPLKR